MASAGTELMTIDEVAERLRVHPTTIRGWIRAKKIHAIRLPGGKDLRLRRADVDALIESGSAA